MVCYLLLTHLLAKKNPTRSRGEKRKKTFKKNCIKVETLVVITQTIDPTRDNPFKKKKIFSRTVGGNCV